jgi:hypothetical protein
MDIVLGETKTTEALNMGAMDSVQRLSRRACLCWWSARAALRGATPEAFYERLHPLLGDVACA